MSEFYVYVHKRNTDNSVFYVGKGKGGRHLSKSGRSNHWRRIVEKHGYHSEIVKRFTSESDAYDFECKLISTMRDNKERICNVANGGNGGLSGIPLRACHKDKLRAAKLGKKQMPEHAKKSALAKKGKKQPRKAVDYVIGLKKKKVINSSGEIFESANEAARCLSKRLGIKASQGNISMVCRGERSEAYGFNWSYDLSCIPKLFVRRLKCSNGMYFSSLTEATEWVKSWRGSASPSNITNAIRENGTAFGFKWKYEEDVLDEDT